MSTLKSLLATTLACTMVLSAVGQAAQPGKGNDPGAKAAKQEKKAHKHQHNNGHNLLGAKLKQNGKHEVGKFANRSVTAEVSNGKVKTMSAGDLAMKRVKTKQKMASADLMHMADGAAMMHLIQYGGYYYGYCFDDGYEYDCYWYPEEDVDYADYTWDDYDPYY